jgi:segregation and condensation protein B
MLLEKKLVRIVGRKKIPGRPLLYATTRQFLELFGLKDRKDLPTQKEIEEISATKQE